MKERRQRTMGDFTTEAPAGARAWTAARVPS